MKDKQQLSGLHAKMYTLSRLTVVSGKAKKKHACASSSLHDHCSELSIYMDGSSKI